MELLRPIEITESILLSSNVTEDDYLEWYTGTSYSTGDLVIVTDSGVHKVYEALRATTGDYPPDNSSDWLEVSSTNRWKMFDDIVGSQTTNADTIEVSVTTSLADSVAFINVNALSVSVTVTDPTEGLVYEETKELLSTSNVVDLFTYFFEPFHYVTDAVFTSIPIYTGATMVATINSTGGTASCGVMVIGKVAALGCTQFGASIGILDYSKKTADDFGNYTILKRAFSKTGTFSTVLTNSTLGFTLATLEAYRSTPAVWIGTGVEYLASPMLIYGFYKDFTLGVEYVGETTCEIEIEGLI